ncbi:hypothetical protein CaCOL14_009775 [Colletotrichum acutatum]
MPPSTNMVPETPPGRGISSRLLTMKFMQRAAASDATPEPSPEEPSSKRRKFQNSPLTGDFHSFDQTAVQAALKQQEAKRLSALEASRVELADTHWVLDGAWDKSTETENAPPNIVYIGYADIDIADGEEEAAATATAQVGRMKIESNKKKATKNAKKETPKKTKPQSSDSDGSTESDDSSDGSSDEDEASSSSDEEASMKTPPKAVKGLASGGQGRTRVNLQAKKSSESMKAKEFREKRMKKEVKLNKLASISGGATGGFSGAGKPNAPFNCHNCNKPGHRAADCPQRQGGKRKSFDRSR